MECYLAPQHFRAALSSWPPTNLPVTSPTFRQVDGLPRVPPLAETLKPASPQTLPTRPCFTARRWLHHAAVTRLAAGQTQAASRSSRPIHLAHGRALLRRRQKRRRRREAPPVWGICNAAQSATRISLSLVNGRPATKILAAHHNPLVREPVPPLTSPARSPRSQPVRLASRSVGQNLHGGRIQHQPNLHLHHLLQHVGHLNSPGGSALIVVHTHPAVR